MNVSLLDLRADQIPQSLTGVALVGLPEGLNPFSFRGSGILVTIILYRRKGCRSPFGVIPLIRQFLDYWEHVVEILLQRFGPAMGRCLEDEVVVVPGEVSQQARNVLRPMGVQGTRLVSDEETVDPVIRVPEISQEPEVPLGIVAEELTDFVECPGQ